MIKIKYNNSDIFEEVTFSKLSDNIVSLKGATENNSGFTTYRMSGEPLGDFSNYTTTYRILFGEIQYSNDGSIWTVPDDDGVWITPEPYESSPEYKINALKQELASTDYEALKYAEGWFTDEEYAPIKAMRESLREQIRALESEEILNAG